jgi:NAD(P)-dependent dehydrogenase (short-subunit alcohol dehydrogenase family)
MEANQNATSLSLTVVREVMESNFFGLIQTTIAFLPLLRKPGHAVVLNVSSELGSNTVMARPNAPAHLVAYKSSKAAVNSYAIALAQELKGEGIKVNAVTPGLTSTNMTNNQRGKSVRAGAEVLLPWALLERDGPTCMLNLLGLRAVYN